MSGIYQSIEGTTTLWFDNENDAKHFLNSVKHFDRDSYINSIRNKRISQIVSKKIKAETSAYNLFNSQDKMTELINAISDIHNSYLKNIGIMEAEIAKIPQDIIGHFFKEIEIPDNFYKENDGTCSITLDIYYENELETDDYYIDSPKLCGFATDTDIHDLIKDFVNFINCKDLVTDICYDVEIESEDKIYDEWVNNNEFFEYNED